MRKRFAFRDEDSTTRVEAIYFHESHHNFGAYCFLKKDRCLVSEHEVLEPKI